MSETRADKEDLLGWTNSMLRLLSILLERVSQGRCRLVRYAIVVQPVPQQPLVSARVRRNMQVRRLLPEDRVLRKFPRPHGVYINRFRQGAIAYCAFVGDEPAGFIWFTPGPYDEDEVHCRYVPEPVEATAWDFDVYVKPEYRHTRVFARLWDAAYAHMRRSGVRWTISRISLFNAASILAHQRLGARKLGIINFFCIGAVQLTLSTLRPYFRLSFKERRKPVFEIKATNDVLNPEPADRVEKLPKIVDPSVSDKPADKPPVVVVGLCAHGLACARALSKSGLTVYGLEAKSWLPGYRTGHATVITMEDINGPGLTTGLETLARERFNHVKPVVILTNDNMVREIAKSWPRLQNFYRLSWSDSRDMVSALLEKSNIEYTCRAAGLHYPRTVYIDSLEQLNATDERLIEFPAIVKPCRPLSRFKTRLVDDMEQLLALMVEFTDDLPFLVQDYIPGTDADLRFVALYLHEGAVVASFVGRKLLSHPPAQGQTTAAESIDDNRILSLATEFFSGTGISGPVSLEFKIDADGVPWVIEPTVGRTDYWLDCCIANGVDFLLVEYLHQTGQDLPAMKQQYSIIWMDAERDPRIAIRVAQQIGLSGWRGRRPRFTYWDWSDPIPCMIACKRFLTARLRRRESVRH